MSNTATGDHALISDCRSAAFSYIGLINAAWAISQAMTATPQRAA